MTSTLKNIEHLLNKNDVQCVIFDDGSTDGTSEFIKLNFSQVIVQRNEVSKGYIYCRNKMLSETSANFAISIDDDAHFLTENPFRIFSVRSCFLLPRKDCNRWPGPPGIAHISFLI